MRTCAVLILNYNGRRLLGQCLPSVVRAVARAGNGCRLVLVDNRSTDDSVTLVRSQFPSVEVIVSPENDYLLSLNSVIASFTNGIAIILNNDIQVFCRHRRAL